VKQLITVDPWNIVQDGFDASQNRVYESLFSLGNGHIGGRGNHEERYSGDSLPGNYLAGIYYPDPTRVGWWKNGYPEYFAKVLNAPDWKPIHLTIDGEPLDLATASIEEYQRELAMRSAELRRRFRATLPNGRVVDVEVVRFVSRARHHVGSIRYRLRVLGGGDHAATVRIESQVDGDVVNEDSNYDERFWDEVSQHSDSGRAAVVTRTRKTGFVAAVATDTAVTVGDGIEEGTWDPLTSPRFAAAAATIDVPAGELIEITKIASLVTSRDIDSTVVDDVTDECRRQLDAATAAGFDDLRRENAESWDETWRTADVVVEGDPAVQQGIRFCIFGLNSTFTGDDPDLNVGPKGFTGEKYGGVTYWDTEAFCLPFYLATAPPEVSRNLLRYRHRQLDKAIENAEKLGFSDGAALYPMVTINGEECHNEWEITFMEIHRNGAIAFAIHDYVRTTGDESVLLDGGLEVLIAISRFWVQRVSWSQLRSRWVMLGVTGPNEYENNVDDNWYTNLMAQWTLRYTQDAIDRAREIDADETSRVVDAVGLDEEAERGRWSEVAETLFLPDDPERQIFLQQANYLDKELLTVDDLDPAERPLNQHWSWDRILRSCYIKQADVLQGMWVLGDRFDVETLRRNFDFYEPMTVHESSLSPSIHAVLAMRLGRREKAREMLVRTARLDLDDINNDTEDGCHTTSMAGTWLAAVQGFGGLQVVDDQLHIDPRLAEGWTGLGFRVRFRGALIAVHAGEAHTTVENDSDQPIVIVVAGEPMSIEAHGFAALSR
jgi:maltose phosphorylase